MKTKLFEFLFLFFIVSGELKKDTLNIYKCGIDKVKPILLTSKNILPIDPNNIKYKRSLDNIDADGFKDFNIFLDLKNFDDEIIEIGLTDKREFFVTGMTKAIDTLKILLKVRPVPNYVFKDEQIKKILINNWDKTKIGDNVTEGMSQLGIDLFIFVRFGNKTEMGESTLASAGSL